MPPKASSSSSTPKKAPKKPSNDDTPLSLPQLLKVLTTAPSSNARLHRASGPSLTMSQAIAAAKILVPKGYTSLYKLTRLTQQDLAAMGIEDEHVRRGISNLTSTAPTSSDKVQEPSTKSSPSRPYKRPRRDEDLDQPLPDLDTSRYNKKQASTLELKSVVTNRAPVMTAWAFIVLERLGFSRPEALSIAQVYTDMNASSKGVSIGVLDKQRLEPGGGPSQPFVELMGRRVPVLSTQNGQWRAIAQGQVVEPSQAYNYIQRNFRQQTGAVMGALRILATSYSPQELNEAGYVLYCDFRPTVEQWGEKAEMKLIDVLSLQKWKTKGWDRPVDSDSNEANGQHASSSSGKELAENGQQAMRVVKIEDQAGQQTTIDATDGEQSTEAGGDVKPIIRALETVTDADQQHLKHGQDRSSPDEFDQLLDDGDDDAFAALVDG
ncbi:hypothetical protein OIO90_002684 [Microbotryomycetes sp. JL221]|nr:hypothetical protein OIO90_002684 [Microbotryomycetes sp. JL221]